MKHLYKGQRKQSERNENFIKREHASENARTGQATRRKGKQRGTTVNINSCNAQFCDPGWEPYPNIVSTVTGYNILHIT